MAIDNRTIGRFHLDGIPPAPRGVPQVEVSFDIDANGILHVAAKDKATGKEQSIRIEASSGLTAEEIEKMRRSARENESEDKRRREEVDKMNTADSLIFSTEKNLNDYGEKIPAEKRAQIDSALDRLKEVHKNRTLSEVDSAIEQLNQAWQAASEDLYKAQQEASTASEGSTAEPTGESDVRDVDYEVVEDEGETA
jgi:molecular chaperone DnaK